MHQTTHYHQPQYSYQQQPYPAAQYGQQLYAQEHYSRQYYAQPQQPQPPQHYNQQQVARNEYAPHQYFQQGFETVVQSSQYPQYNDGHPSKRQKISPGQVANRTPFAQHNPHAYHQGFYQAPPSSYTESPHAHPYEAHAYLGQPPPPGYPSQIPVPPPTAHLTHPTTWAAPAPASLLPHQPPLPTPPLHPPPPANWNNSQFPRHPHQPHPAHQAPPLPPQPSPSYNAWQQNSSHQWPKPHSISPTGPPTPAASHHSQQSHFSASTTSHPSSTGVLKPNGRGLLNRPSKHNHWRQENVKGQLRENGHGNGKVKEEENEHDDMAWLDYARDDYYLGEEEAVNSNLSLGEIVWEPARGIGKALPARFVQAEKWAKKQIPASINKVKGSVSQYISSTNESEHCVPVYLTSEWESIRLDPVFTEFNDETAAILLPISALVAHVRNEASNITSGDQNSGDDDELVDEFEARDNEDAQNVQTGSPHSTRSPASVYIFSDETPNVVPRDTADIIKPQNVELSDKAETIPSDVKPRHTDADNQNSPLNGHQSCNQIHAIDNDDDDDVDEPYSPPPLGSPVPVYISGNDGESSLNGEMDMEIDANSDDSSTPEPIIEVPVQAVAVQTERASDIVSIKQEVPHEHALPKKPPVPPASRPFAQSRPLQFERDDTQEDILARLGVTGAPKPVYAKSGPAYKPRVEPYGNGLQKSLTNPSPNLSGPEKMVQPSQPPPPPPPIPIAMPVEFDELDPWCTNYRNDASRHSPKSVTSQHTVAGSDFDLSDNETSEKADLKSPANDHTEAIKTVEPSPEENTNQKVRPRIRADSQEPDDGIKRQKDDGISSRLRKRQPRVAAAYSRRW